MRPRTRAAMPHRVLAVMASTLLLQDSSCCSCGHGCRKLTQGGNECSTPGLLLMFKACGEHVQRRFDRLAFDCPGATGAQEPFCTTTSR
jgi:hypothetical protein